MLASDMDKDFDKEPRSYISYLLRLQRVRGRGGWIWRASLESPATGERQSFLDLPSLFAFLEEQTCVETPREETDLGSQ
ncbi:MAG: hypothetical protein ACE5LU_02710 [Anaerolineae bacterium]